MGWFFSQPGWVLTVQINLETLPQKCPEVCLLGDSESHEVDSEGDLHINCFRGRDLTVSEIPLDTLDWHMLGCL